jgi:UDP-glucose 4-epimerase/UDP-glucuronate decarboxylase
MNKILITGAAGFIGFKISEQLATNNKQNKLVLVDNLDRGQMDDEFKKLINQDNVEFVNCDLTVEEDIMKIDEYYDQVYHLAAKVGVKHTHREPEEILRVNIISLMNIIDLITRNNCPRVLFTSTSEVYSCGHDYGIVDIPTDETAPLVISDPFNPRFSYAGSKIVGEQMIIHNGNQNNFDYNIDRYHNIYGPRMGYAHVVPEVIKRIEEEEEPFKIYGYDQTRAFCYIDDAARATIDIMETKEVNKEIFHIGNDSQEIKIEKLIKKLFQIADYDPEYELVAPPEGSVARRCPDIYKAKKLLDYTPQVSLEEGLKLTYQWYKEDLDKNGAWE